MFMQPQEDSGHQNSVSESPVSTWRQLPPEATGGNVATAAPATYEEHLQSVLEDSERHLDALWSMLNSQMVRLSTEKETLTSEAQALPLTALSEPASRMDAAEEIAPTATAARQPLDIGAFWKPMPTDVPPHLEIVREAEPLMQTVAAPIAEMSDESEAEAAAPLTPEAAPEHDAVTEETADTDAPDAAEEIPAIAETEDQEEWQDAAPAQENAAETHTPATMEDAPGAMEMEPEAKGEKELLPTPAAVDDSAESAETTEPLAADAPAVAAEAETPPAPLLAPAVPEVVRPVSTGRPAVWIESTYRDNWLTVTAREAGGTAVLPTIRLMMQLHPTQSLQMRSMASGELPVASMPLVWMESTEEAGAEPAAMRVEIAYTSETPDVIFEVKAQVKDEVQITMSDQGSDLCASWEVNKQKGKSARAKATISRISGEPAIVVELHRFRKDDDPAVWQSALSFFIAPRS